MLVRGQDFEAGAAGDVARGDLGFALDLEGCGNLLAFMQAQTNFLEVEDDVGHVLLDAGQSRKLVQDVFDPDCRNRVAGQRGQQDAPQRVANGDSVAAFERFRGKFAVGRSDFLLVELDRLGFDQISPVILHSLCSFFPMDFPRPHRSTTDRDAESVASAFSWVMLDYQLLADRHRQFGARRQRPERGAELFALECDPRRYAAALRHLDCLDDHLLGAARLGYADHTANLDQGRGNRDFPAVNVNVPVTNHLARLRQRAREAETVHDVIEAPLEQYEQVLAGDSVHPLRHREVSLKLRLHHSVDALDLLLLAQPNREFRETRARLAGSGGRIIAPLDRALVAVASLSLEEEFQSLAPTQAAYWPQVSCHSFSLFSVNPLD